MIHKLEDPSILADGVEIINQYPLAGIAIAACRWSYRHVQQFQGDGATTAPDKEHRRWNRYFDQGQTES
jgi:hypothetical protein